MASKVLTLGIQLPQIQTKSAVYRDVSMVAELANNTGYDVYSKPIYLSDYFEYIGTEKTLSAVMTEDSVVSQMDFQSIADSAAYREYVLQLDNISNTLRQTLLDITDKLSANDDDASCLTDDEKRLYVRNYDSNYFRVDLPAPLRVIAVEIKKGYAQAMKNYAIAQEKSKYRVGQLTDIAAVQNSLKQIFTWIQGERILLPEFGSRLQLYLYEGITDSNTEQIISEIRSCVSRWEPRVTIDGVVNQTTVDDVENNTIHLEILYSIPSLSRLQYSYSYVYNR